MIEVMNSCMINFCVSYYVSCAHYNSPHFSPAIQYQHHVVEIKKNNLLPHFIPSMEFQTSVTFKLSCSLQTKRLLPYNTPTLLLQFLPHILRNLCSQTNRTGLQQIQCNKGQNRTKIQSENRWDDTPKQI